MHRGYIGFKVLGFRVQGLGFGVYRGYTGFRVLGLGSGVYGGYIGVM